MPYAKNGEINIYYEVEGEGPPLVIQHGFGGDLESWRTMGYVNELDNSYQLILVDARGHGKSDKPHEVDAYDSEKRAGDVIAVLDASGIDKTNYFGYSMGGRMGYEIARYFPSRVNSLIIGAAPAGARGVEENNERLAALEKGMESFAELVERMGPMPPAMKESLLANDNKALFAAQKAGWPNTEGYLPEMRMPFLLFVGENDPLFSEVVAVSKILPDATIFTVPGANHMEVIRNKAEIVLSHVREFLARVTK